MLSGIALAWFARRLCQPLDHDWVSLATRGTKACDAAGDAFRPQSREWPAPVFRRVLPERRYILSVYAQRRRKNDSASTKSATRKQSPESFITCYVSPARADR